MARSRDATGLAGFPVLSEYSQPSATYTRKTLEIYIRRRRSHSSPNDETHTAKMPSNRLTYVSVIATILRNPILTVFAAPQATVSFQSRQTNATEPRSKNVRKATNTERLYRYNTKSNKVRVIKTPGGELRYLHIKKKGTAPKCGDCGLKLAGVSTPHDRCRSFGRWPGMDWYQEMEVEWLNHTGRRRRTWAFV